jgi:hypothetical protein
MIDHCQCERSCLLVSITFTITIPHLLNPTKVRTHLFSTAYRHGNPKTARLQSDHASSFSAAGLMMTDDAIAAKAARTVANGMRPPTLLFSISLIARGLTRTLVRSGGRGFLDGRAERWRKGFAWRGRSDVFVPSTRLTISLFFLYHIVFGRS